MNKSSNRWPSPDETNINTKHIYEMLAKVVKVSFDAIRARVMADEDIQPWHVNWFESCMKVTTNPIEIAGITHFMRHCRDKFMGEKFDAFLAERPGLKEALEEIGITRESKGGFPIEDFCNKLRPKTDPISRACNILHFNFHHDVEGTDCIVMAIDYERAWTTAQKHGLDPNDAIVNVIHVDAKDEAPEPDDEGDSFSA